MNKDFKELTPFIKSMIPSLEFPKTRFSTQSKNILQQLCEKLVEAETEWEIHYPKKFVVESIFKKKGEPFPKSSDFSFFPEEIKRDILNKNKTGFLYKFTIHGRQYETVIMHIGNTLPKSAKLFTEAIQKVFMWLYVAGSYANNQCSRKMNIYLYWTDIEKTLPAMGKPIEMIHANTAFTTSCREVTELNLFRREEWFKVFVHETFHNMGLDFSAYPQQEVVSYILNVFPLKSDIKLYETYCETWAEIMNLLFLAYKDKNPIQKVEKMLDLERVFSAFQCMKVLHFYGLEYSDLYEKTNAAHLARMQKYKESTNILSYYILKSLFLFFVDDFLVWCGETNGKKVIQFGKMTVQENMMKYCDFIGNRFMRKEYTDLLKDLEPWFHSKETNHKPFEKIRRTMRMTVFG